MSPATNARTSPVSTRPPYAHVAAGQSAPSRLERPGGLACPSGPTRCPRAGPGDDAPGTTHHEPGDCGPTVRGASLAAPLLVGPHVKRGRVRLRAAVRRPAFRPIAWGPARRTAPPRWPRAGRPQPGPGRQLAERHPGAAAGFMQRLTDSAHRPPPGCSSLERTVDPERLPAVARGPREPSLSWTT
jgi:hypothetical protein